MFVIIYIEQEVLNDKIPIITEQIDDDNNEHDEVGNNHGKVCVCVCILNFLESMQE